MISPIPTQRFITNRYADGRSVRSWLPRLRPLGCASKSANHVGVHGVSAFWPNRRCRKYSSTSPTIRYSSSTHRPITLRRVGGNLAPNARTQQPAAPDATAADPGCTAARAPCCAACTSSQALLLCTGVKSAQMRQCTTRGDSRENRELGDDVRFGNLHIVLSACRVSKPSSNSQCRVQMKFKFELLRETVATGDNDAAPTQSRIPLWYRTHPQPVPASS